LVGLSWKFKFWYFLASRKPQQIFLRHCSLFQQHLGSLCVRFIFYLVSYGEVPLYKRNNFVRNESLWLPTFIMRADNHSIRLCISWETIINCFRWTHWHELSFILTVSSLTTWKVLYYIKDDIYLDQSSLFMNLWLEVFRFERIILLT